MLREMVIRNTRTLNKLTSPKLVNSISKYMYIRKLIDEFEISLILDVGANIGQFGTSMRELGYTGTLVSFEPVAAQFAKLKAAANGDPNLDHLELRGGRRRRDKIDKCHEFECVFFVQRTVEAADIQIR